MKQITNWESATVFDTESDGLLDEATYLHVLSCTMKDGKEYDIKGDKVDKIRSFCQYHIDNKIPVVAHYGILFDKPLLEKILGIDLSELMLIDTVILSWYLNVHREIHGLDSFFDDYGIAKPKIDDWENLTYEEYLNRVKEDVRINVALWEDFKERLVDMYSRVKEEVDSGFVDGKRLSKDEVCYIDQYKGKSSVSQYIDRILTFLMFKLDCIRLQEKTRFKTNREAWVTLEEELTASLDASKEELGAVMPKVPKYSDKKKAAKPYLQSGELSVSGKSWNEAVAKIGVLDELGNPLAKEIEGEYLKIKVLNKYEEPNVQSPLQIKEWLFSHGWQPENFKFVKDEKKHQIWVDSGFKKSLKPKPRKIPQINVDTDDGKELCPSVVRLAKKAPEVMAYSKFTLVKHRRDMILGFLRDMSEDGYLKGRIGGLANTFRIKHREIYNLPSVSKPYGKEIRGGFIANKGNVLIGSDLSSLEDRTKHHFMLPHDPEYVTTMMDDDYDPHIATALSAGLITQQEFDGFMRGNPSANAKKQRPAGKTCNYASVYSAGAETIARGAGVSLALGKALHKGYWELNWSVKTIAEEQCIIVDNLGYKWLVNPINGFCYSIRKESDRFSTLCQGTGSFFFDMWLDNVLTAMREKYKVERLNFQAHDEFVSEFRDTPKNRVDMEKITKDAIHKVNEDFLLRRKLGCDVQFGENYAQIH